MATVHSFEDLNCWKAATELRREISRLVKSFPPQEKFSLISQTVRASRSVTNNIAEGFGRYHYQEFIQFCRIARGSLAELLDHLIIANDEAYISNVQLDEFRTKIEKATALINGFINYLESKTSPSKSRVEESVEPYGLTSTKYILETITDNV
jgi:four helix bundle protein